MNAQLIVTADGVGVTTIFHESDPPPASHKGAVLIVPAMGVAQRFYLPLAGWLAKQGYLAVTFDYRGIGLSRPRRLRGFQADILTWARLDCAAVLEAVSRRAPQLPLYWIGHSLGGQILPFVPGAGKVVRAVMVGSGSGYWRENAGGLRLRAPLLWYVIAPASTAICGYFPGRRLKIIGDLPAGVLAQWRRWCLHPDYALSEGGWARERYAAVTTPLVLFSFTDDEYMSARSIESLSGWYSMAPQTPVRLDPRQLGVPRIGHFGFFRSSFERSLWQDRLLPLLSPPAPGPAPPAGG